MSAGPIDPQREPSASPIIVDDSLAETLDILRDPGMVNAIAEGEAAVARGDVVSLDEFRRIVGGLRR